MTTVKRIESLDLLRGLASFIVAFFWHYQHFGVSANLLPAYLKFSDFYRRGWIFVEFFFILSGFIFSYVYLDKIRKNGISELRGYAVSRFARLYPLHVLTLLLVLMLLVVNQGSFIYHDNTIKKFLLNLFFLQNGFFDTTFSFNGPSWSVSCEILMYVLFFWIICKDASNRIAWFVGLFFLGQIIFKVGINLPVFNEQIAQALIYFFFGCLIFEISSWTVFNNRYVKMSLFIGIVLIYAIPKWAGQEIYGSWEFVYAIFLFPALILLFSKSNTISRLSANDACRFIGDMSYGVYLLHYPVQFFILIINKRYELKIDFSSPLTLLLYVTITLSVSSIIHYFFERPASKFLRGKLNSRYTSSV